MDPVKLAYKPHIDGLRAVAVLSVLGFHAFPRAVTGGFIGVDIFFVISGFLISSILYAEFGASGSKGDEVIVNFYAKRVRRIFPALIVVLIACLVAGFLLLLPDEFEKLSLHVVASAGFFLNFLLSGETGYFNGDSGSNPLLHLWSLGVEEQFYLFWPLAIWLAIRCRAKILPAAVFAAACSYFWNAQKFESSAAAAFYLPQMRMWELLIGAIAAALFPLAPRSRSGDGKNVLRAGGILWANAFPALGIALIGAGLALIRSSMSVPNAWTLLPTVGAAFIVCSESSAWINRRILSHRVLVWIGLISYPLYLWHWPLLAFARIGADHPDSPWMKGGLLLAAGVLAWLTYRFVEIPVRHGGRLPRRAAALAGTMAAIAVLGYYAHRESGFPSRFPPLLRAISDSNYDPAIPWRQGTYFLMGDQDETKFKKDPDEIAPNKPALYLWGDSHAAALYPGLSDAFGGKYSIVQRTAATTPPFVPDRFPPGNGRQITQYVFDSIKRDRPECVVLEADWPRYKWNQIEETIVALKAGGVRHVVLVGPVPQWNVSLPQQLFNYARRHRGEPVPVRMTQGINPAPLEIDPLMARLAERLGVQYISPCRILENRDGFLVRTGDTADSLMVYDAGHLTERGSKYLVSRFPKL